MVTALTLSLAAALTVQLGAWAWIQAGFRRARAGGPPDGAEAPPVPISVVVAAHDEADRLPALLDALAAQTHRGADGEALFEVVVVDDRSADGTADVVAARADGFPAPLRLVRIAPGDAPETVHYLPDLWADAADVPLAPKKNALTRGIAAAAHERLALTDADTAPPPGWLATLARWAAADDAAPGDGNADGDAVLVGYGPLTGGGWLGQFARYETALTATLSAAGIGHGRAWHAVGRNLSYTAGTFRAADGFRPFAESLSGDDDLFVQAVAGRGLAPVRAVLDPAAFVPSPAPATWRAFWRQKRRHSSGGAFYDARVLRALGLFQATSLALWVGAPALHLAFGAPWGWGLLAVKLLAQRAVMSEAWETLGAGADLSLWHPVLDAIYSAYQVAASALGLLPVPKAW